MPLRARAAPAFLVLVASVPAAPAMGSLDPVLAGHYPAAERAAAAAHDPAGIQAAYDAAREMREALRRMVPTHAACVPLHAALVRYADARTRQMEGQDRPSAADARAGASAARASRGRIARAARACRVRTTRRPAPALAMAPADGEAFFGAVVVRAPVGADRARLTVDGTPAGEARVRGGRVRFAVGGAAGPRHLRVRFLAGAAHRGPDAVAGAVLLPASARGAGSAPAVDAGVERALEAALGGEEYRAAWVHDLRGGRAGGLDADVPYPAASLVKLGLAAGAMARLGPSAGRSAFAHDLRSLATWSSNLAANRLQRRLGGTATALEGLRRLGATHSTYPGEYLAGTAREAAAAPPQTSRRITTARDMGRALAALHGAAAGGPRPALDARSARLLLGWLLASEQRAQNVSLLAGGAGATTPVAQKNGWTSSLRHAAGILYTPAGPRIAVFLSYTDGGLSIARGRTLAGAVARIATG